MRPNVINLIDNNAPDINDKTDGGRECSGSGCGSCSERWRAETDFH